MEGRCEDGKKKSFQNKKKEKCIWCKARQRKEDGDPPAEDTQPQEAWCGAAMGTPQTLLGQPAVRSVFPQSWVRGETDVHLHTYRGVIQV